MIGLFFPCSVRNGAVVVGARVFTVIAVVNKHRSDCQKNFFPHFNIPPNKMVMSPFGMQCSIRFGFTVSCVYTLFCRAQKT